MIRPERIKQLCQLGEERHDFILKVNSKILEEIQLEICKAIALNKEAKYCFYHSNLSLELISQLRKLGYQISLLGTLTNPCAQIHWK